MSYAAAAFHSRNGHAFDRPYNSRSGDFDVDNSPSLFRDFTSMKKSNYSLATITFTLATFALQLIAEAVVPPPDGGYPGGNTAEGQNALLRLTTGTFNTAVGFFALRSNDLGNYNTAVGAGALVASSDSAMNTAVGAATLLANIADGNTATGAGALLSNFSGFANTANGESVLSRNTTGSFNTATGGDALFSNSIGGFNTANGFDALTHNVDGSNNTAVGIQALYNLTTGNANTALGSGAGSGVSTASNVICIGIDGADVNDSCFIGNVHGVTTQNNDAIPVLIDSAGQLGTISSSRRYKTEIQPLDKASESILALKPVSFRYKMHKDGKPQFGLIAEDVASVNPDLVVRDKNGEIYTVRYDAVNAMLLNEFLKEHRKVEELESAMARQRERFETAVVQQQKTTEALATRLIDQEARIQKVSARVEMRKSGSQMLVENQ